MDFQDGLDMFVIEKLGVKLYSNTGAAGTILRVRYRWRDVR